MLSHRQSSPDSCSDQMLASVRRGKQLAAVVEMVRPFTLTIGRRYRGHPRRRAAGSRMHKVTGCIDIARTVIAHYAGHGQIGQSAAPPSI